MSWFGLDPTNESLSAYLLNRRLLVGCPLCVFNVLLIQLQNGVVGGWDVDSEQAFERRCAPGGGLRSCLVTSGRWGKEFRCGRPN